MSAARPRSGRASGHFSVVFALSFSVEFLESLIASRYNYSKIIFSKINILSQESKKSSARGALAPLLMRAFLALLAEDVNFARIYYCNLPNYLPGKSTQKI